MADFIIIGIQRFGRPLPFPLSNVDNLKGEEWQIFHGIEHHNQVITVNVGTLYN